MPTNNDRAATASTACPAFAVAAEDPEYGEKTWQTEPDTVIVDLLADMLHLCDRKDLNFAQLLDSAQDHYRSES